MNRMNRMNKGLLAIALLLVANATFAQGGQTAISDATTEIADYLDVVGPLIQAIGAVVGVIGGLRIYNKWTSGDQDVNKELVSWGGACIFLVLVPTVIEGFFGL